jgi:Na+-transporting NADH:ubiquinone oxidoreductase subunit NqrA
MVRKGDYKDLNCNVIKIKGNNDLSKKSYKSNRINNRDSVVN